MITRTIIAMPRVLAELGRVVKHVPVLYTLAQ